jgi:hypothetical protein
MDTLDKEVLEMRAKFAKRKLVAMANIGWVKKQGKLDAGKIKYDYVTAADVIAEIRSPLEKAGLAFVARNPSVTRETIKESKTVQGDRGNYETAAMYLYTMTIEMGLMDYETGYEDVSKWIGEGSDTGDKGIPKAFTAALKYYMIQQFLIPTGDDPEADDSPRDEPSPPSANKQPKKDFYTGQGKTPDVSPTKLKSTPEPAEPPITEPPLIDQIADRMLGPEPIVDNIRRPQTDEEIAAVAKIVDFLQNKFGEPVDYNKVCELLYTKTTDRPGGFVWPKRVGKLQLDWIDKTIKYGEVAKF